MTGSISATPTTDKRFPLQLARAALVALLVLVLIGLALALPRVFAAIQAGWDFNEFASALSPWVSYETLTAIAAAVELTLVAIFLATAALLLAQPPRWITLLAALAVLLLPVTFEVAGLPPTEASSGPLAGLATIMDEAGFVVTLTSLLLLYFLFPDGRLAPRWLWALPLIVVVAMGVAVLAPDSAAWSWGLFIAVTMLALLSASAVQIVRFQRAESTQRRQTVWFMVALLAFIANLLVSVTGQAPALSYTFGYVALVLLPVSLTAAVWRGVWPPAPGTRSQVIFLAVVGLSTLGAVTGSAVWLNNNRLEPVNVATLDLGQPVPVLLDADMAMDDITALFYLLHHPGVAVQAITVNGVAFAHCDGGVRNTLGLLELAQAPDIPVACGREEAYPGGTPAPEEWRKNADSLYGASVRLGGRTADERPAAELLADTIQARPGEIIVLAVGPLTNLADAFAADPALPGLIKQIVIMGGAVDVPGNVANEAEGITNQVAEWNFFADPAAADIVLNSGAPILLVPLDATNDVPFSRGFHQRLSSQHLTKPATFTYNLFYLNPWWLDGGMYWWDTLAAAAAIDPSLVTTEAAALDVVTEAGPEAARTVRVSGGAPVQLATGADAQRFEALLLALLNRQGQAP